jgi:hypothetical protein
MAKKPFERPPLKKSDIVWNDSDNATGEYSATHGMYGRDRLTAIGRYTGERKPGNSALCNHRYGVMDESENFLPIEAVEENSTYDQACKSCKKIYDSLPK